MKKKLITKLFFYSLISLSILMPSFSNAEIRVDKWSKSCGKPNENKKQSCIIGILNQFENPETKKKQTLATIYIQKTSSSKKVMNLVSEEDQTYKVGEEITNALVLVAHLPLNSDLTKKPVVAVDNKNILNMFYLYCNNKIGCRAMGVLNNEMIKKFKEGEDLSIVMPVFNSNPVKLDFPLKGFSKSFKKFTK